MWRELLVYNGNLHARDVAVLACLSREWRVSIADMARTPWARARVRRDMFEHCRARAPAAIFFGIMHQQQQVHYRSFVSVATLLQRAQRAWERLLWRAVQDMDAGWGGGCHLHRISAQCGADQRGWCNVCTSCQALLEAHPLPLHQLDVEPLRLTPRRGIRVGPRWILDGKLPSGNSSCSFCGEHAVRWCERQQHHVLDVHPIVLQLDS